MSDQGPAEVGTERGLFTRKATGLVREIGGRDAFLLNLFWLNLFVGILIVTQAPGIFPGLNVWLGFLLAAVLLVIPMLVYAMMSSAMPRAGGDYVYISRVIHPAVGSVFGIAFTIMITLFLAIFAALVSIQCLSSIFGILGTVGENETLIQWSVDVTGDTWRFIIGVVAIIAVAAINMFGVKPLMAVVRVFFFIAMLGIVIAIILMATHNQADFAAAFAEYGDVSEIIAAADAEGLGASTATSSFGDLLAFLALGFTFLAFAQFPAYAAGELRRPRRTAIVAMLGGLAFAGVLFVILSLLANHTFGNDFLGAMEGLFFGASESYPAIPAPWLFLYAGFLTDSIILNVIMSVGILLSFLGAMAMLTMVASRNLVAYSLDGVMPEALRKTDERYHAPRYAIAACATVALLFYIPYTFGPEKYFDFLFSGALLLAIVFLATMLTAIVFPYRLKAVFESSPYNGRVAGIPTVTVLGVLGSILYGWWVITLLTDDRIGANSTAGIVGIIVIFAIALLWYIAAWAIAKGKGVDLALRHRELPPE